MDLKKLLSEYFCEVNNIDITKKYIIETIDAKKLIVKERMDLIVKLKYVEYKDKGYNVSFIKELYTAHIEAFSLGRFSEPGNANKNSIDKYFEYFDIMINDIKKNGFNKELSLIPVGQNGVILDGSHRVAIAAYYNLKVSIIRFDNSYASYDTEYFMKRCLDERYIDYLVTEYTKQKKDIYFACVWPRAKDEIKKREADLLIKESTNVIYRKKIKLNYEGLYNLIFQIYLGQDWIGNVENNYEGAKVKRDACYDKNEFVTIYVFEGNSFESVIELKKEIRDIFRIGNHSIHMTDTKEEAIQMSTLLLNKNSRKFLNNGKPNVYLRFISQINEFKVKLIEQSLPLEDFVIESSSTLALYGLRDVGDIDFVSISNKYKVVENEMMHNHHQYVHFYKKTIDDIVLNPNNYFYFNDLKFITLELLKEFKKNRFENKDQLDLKLMESINKSKSKGRLVILKLEIFIKRKLRNSKYLLRENIVFLFKKIGIYNFVKNKYITIKRLK